jgi:hypothetical protein
MAANWPAARTSTRAAAFAMKFAWTVKLHHIICCLKLSLVKTCIASVFWRWRICRDSPDKSISDSIILGLNSKNRH